MVTETTGPAVQAHERPGQRKVDTLVDTPADNLAVMRRQTTQMAGLATNSLVSGKQDKVDDTCVVMVAR